MSTRVRSDNLISKHAISQLVKDDDESGDNAAANIIMMIGCIKQIRGRKIVIVVCHRILDLECCEARGNSY